MSYKYSKGAQVIGDIKAADDSERNTQIDFENKQNSKIIFDYGGPNIGKPLHVGHMRTLNIGRSLYNIHSLH